MTDLTFRPLQPEQDAPLIHGWVTHPRGRFWGMGDKSVEEIRDVYAFVDSLEAHWAWIGEVEGRPVALVSPWRGQLAGLQLALARRGLAQAEGRGLELVAHRVPVERIAARCRGRLQRPRQHGPHRRRPAAPGAALHRRRAAGAVPARIGAGRGRPGFH